MKKNFIAIILTALMLGEPLVFACNSEEEKEESLVDEAITLFSFLAIFLLIGTGEPSDRADL